MTRPLTPRRKVTTGKLPPNWGAAERARWLDAHPDYDDDPITGPAPHSPPHPPSPTDGCELCAKWRLAVRRGIRVDQLPKAVDLLHPNRRA